MSKNNRRVSRGTIIILILAALLLGGLGLGWARCGLGQGGSGDSRGEGPKAAADIPPDPASADASPPTCALQVASDGAIMAGGDKLTLAGAVARCEGAAVATVRPAGNAPFGAVQDLRKALEDAGITVREP